MKKVAKPSRYQPDPPVEHQGLTLTVTDVTHAFHADGLPTVEYVVKCRYQITGDVVEATDQWLHGQLADVWANDVRENGMYTATSFTALRVGYYPGSSEDQRAVISGRAYRNPPVFRDLVRTHPLVYWRYAHNYN